MENVKKFFKKKRYKDLNIIHTPPRYCQAESLPHTRSILSGIPETTQHYSRLEDQPSTAEDHQRVLDEAYAAFLQREQNIKNDKNNEIKETSPEQNFELNYNSTKLNDFKKPTYSKEQKQQENQAQLARAVRRRQLPQTPTKPSYTVSERSTKSKEQEARSNQAARGAIRKHSQQRRYSKLESPSRSEEVTFQASRQGTRSQEIYREHSERYPTQEVKYSVQKDFVTADQQRPPFRSPVKPGLESEGQFIATKTQAGQENSSHSEIHRFNRSVTEKSESVDVLRYEQRFKNLKITHLESETDVIPDRRNQYKRFSNRLLLLSPLESVDYGRDSPEFQHSPEEWHYFENPLYVEMLPSPDQVVGDHLTDDHTESHHTKYQIGRMGSLKVGERKVIIEFCHLLEKSKQLFNGLRELPQYGHKQWHSYFSRTFDVYTKLWKFQQSNREVLDSKYGLKRWQIGEIASKIGQLYYHFYLRTSETGYLKEAFSFYSAIKGRRYYTKASKEDKCELMVKKLRYYTRFIVVGLLLNKTKAVRDLIKELERQIIVYGKTYDPEDQMEWSVVIDEVKAFIQAEPIISVLQPDNYPVVLSHRMSAMTTIPVERTPHMIFSLQDVLIIGSNSQQVKFSELTIDMFRMLQTLEREPGEIEHTITDDSPRQRPSLSPIASNSKGYHLEVGASCSKNPHKFLLFKPSPSQIQVYLASACNDLPTNGALLLYISAEGLTVQPSKHPDDGYENGGLITISNVDLYRDNNMDRGSQAVARDLQCFHPGDLYPFTRKPLFIIIDSDNSYAFQNIPRYFGQPLVVLMSPVELPPSLQAFHHRQQGNLFTLFLHSPLTAFCHCCDVHTVTAMEWEKAQEYIETFLADASQILTRNRTDVNILNFMGDDFLRLLILRFIFCEVVLRMHRAFRARTHFTRSSPAIPEDVLEHPGLAHIVLNLASHLQVRGSFHDPSMSGPLPGND